MVITAQEPNQGKLLRVLHSDHTGGKFFAMGGALTEILTGYSPLFNSPALRSNKDFGT